MIQVAYSKVFLSDDGFRVAGILSSIILNLGDSIVEAGSAADRLLQMTGEHELRHKFCVAMLG